MEVIIGIFVLFFPLLLTGPIAAVIFITLLKRDDRWLRRLFWLVLIGINIVVGIFIAETFRAGIFPGPGCFVTLLTPLVALITTLFFRSRTKSFYTATSHDQRQRRWFRVAMILIPLLQLSAPLIGFGYSRQCAALDRQAARPIIAALEAYKNENGHYPSLPSPYQSDLQILVPDYLADIPSRTCTQLFAPADPHPLDSDWSLYFCNNSPERETLLLVPIIGSPSQQIYNPETGQWTAGNSLDGYCP